MARFTSRNTKGVINAGEQAAARAGMSYHEMRLAQKARLKSPTEMPEVEKADMIANTGYMAEMGAGFIAMIATPFYWIGGKLGSTFGKPFNAIGNGFKSVQTFVTTPLGETAAKISGKVTGRSVAVASGSLERTLEGWGAKAENFVKRSPRLSQWREKHVISLTKKAESNRAAAEDVYKAAVGRLEAAESALPGTFADVKAVLRKARGVAGAFNARVFDPKAFEAHQKLLDGHLDNFKEVVRGLPKGISVEERAALKLARNTLQRPFYARLFGEQGLIYAHKAAHSRLEIAAEHEAAAAFRGNLREGFASLPKRISEMTGGKALWRGAYGFTQATSVYRIAHTYTSDMAIMKDMYQSLTGEKASSWKILFGDVPVMMKEARKQFVLSALPQTIVQLVGMKMNAVQNRSGALGKVLVISALTQMGASAVGGMASDRYGLLTAYQMIAKAQATGEKGIPKGAYMGLLVHASKEVARMDQNDASLLAVAQQYADEGKSPGKVLLEVQSGAFAKRLAEAKSAPIELPKEEQAALRADIDAKAPGLTVAQGEDAHLKDRVENARAKPESADMSVVGPHTGKEKIRRAGKAVVDAAEIANVGASVLGV